LASRSQFSERNAINVDKSVIKRMLSTTLVTNEVKDSTGAEVEFQSLSFSDRQHVYAKSGETPSLPYRITISHQESGKSMKLRRRSVIRVDKTTISGVDDVTPITTSAYIVLDHPTGASETNAEAAHVLANLLSFCATTGAGTTVLFDGTGTGSAALLSGAV